MNLLALIAMWSVLAHAPIDIDSYKEQTGLDTVNSVYWCDPVPDCSIYQVVRPDISRIPGPGSPIGDGSTVFIVVVVANVSDVPRPGAEIAFLEALTGALREDGFEILAVAYLDSNAFSTALKCDLSKQCD